MIEVLFIGAIKQHKVGIFLPAPAVDIVDEFPTRLIYIKHADIATRVPERKTVAFVCQIVVLVLPKLTERYCVRLHT